MMSANSPVVKRWFKRFLVATGILAVGLILGILVITPPSAETQSAAVVTENEDSLQRGIDASAAQYSAMAEYDAAAAPAERGADFDFVDHELRFAGGYALVAPAERGAGFDFVDHELRFAGGYALTAASR
jgi:hypothetical protein